MVYATTFHFLLNGRVVAGPKAGTVYNQHRQALADHYLNDAIVRAEGYRGLYVGTVEVYSEQYREVKPAKLANDEDWRPARNKKGGTLIVRHLAIITHPELKEVPHVEG